MMKTNLLANIQNRSENDAKNVVLFFIFKKLTNKKVF